MDQIKPIKVNLVKSAFDPSGLHQFLTGLASKLFYNPILINLAVYLLYLILIAVPILLIIGLIFLLKLF